MATAASVSVFPSNKLEKAVSTQLDDRAHFLALFALPVSLLSLVSKYLCIHGALE